MAFPVLGSFLISSLVLTAAILGSDLGTQRRKKPKRKPSKKPKRQEVRSICDLEAFLGIRVLGQGAALKKIVKHLVSIDQGLGDHSRPRGSFFLKGPSGVGKTETAKALSDFFDVHLVRLDMPEYVEDHRVAQLIGSPPGYVGSEKGGVLTEAVKKNPCSVILFDELEKAHSSFGDILLQIIDDGRLTDNQGQTVDFTQSIIIVTTNSNELLVDFKPELIGRFNAVIEFEPLGKEILRILIDKELCLLNEKLREKSLSVTLDEGCYEALIERSYDPLYGARILKNQFFQIITAPFSEALLEGSLKKGAVEAVFEGGEVSFRQ